MGMIEPTHAKSFYVVVIQDLRSITISSSSNTSFSPRALQKDAGPNYSTEGRED